MIRLAVLLVGVSLLPQPAHATPIALTPPASLLFVGSGGGLGDNRGAYVTATANFGVTHVGIALSLFPSAGTTLIADIYAASGFGRGPLLSSATANIQSSGTAIQFYDVPIFFSFASGVDYDISIRFPNWTFPQGDPAINLVRYYEFEPFFGSVPFNVAGLVTVRDGEASGCAQCNGLLPHLQLTVSEPMVTSLTATPSVLWPPNHKMIPVSVTVTATGYPSPACQISSIVSSESSTKPGQVEWALTGPLSADLRAERAGAGPGRLYTIEVNCTNGPGTSSSGFVTVTVPHDQR